MDNNFNSPSRFRQVFRGNDDFIRRPSSYSPYSIPQYGFNQQHGFNNNYQFGGMRGNNGRLGVFGGGDFYPPYNNPFNRYDGPFMNRISSYESPFVNRIQPFSRPMNSFIGMPGYNGMNGFNNMNGYSLMSYPFSNRPSIMDRPISVYGNNSGFYFPSNIGSNHYAYQPRQNDSITFNQHEQIITAPNNVQDQQYGTYQQQAANVPNVVPEVSQAVIVPEVSQTTNTYHETQNTQQETQNTQQANEQASYQQSSQNSDANINHEYSTDTSNHEYENTSSDHEYYSENHDAASQESYSSSGFQYYYDILRELESYSNGSEKRAAMLVSQDGSVIAQGYNYIDESGQEYEAEQYAIPETYYNGGAYGCFLYVTSAPKDIVQSLVLDSMVSGIYVLAWDSNEEELIRKEKRFKKEKKFYDKNNIGFDIIKIQ